MKTFSTPDIPIEAKIVAYDVERNGIFFYDENKGIDIHVGNNKYSIILSIDDENFLLEIPCKMYEKILKVEDRNLKDKKLFG